ncbi:MAG: tetratricopeptide repeat-containing serine/threonine-protein kinase [Prevotella sp.]|nr:tetratricopeptide repeat-containing serine/threonine-protein kinase [Prevotella sp.]MCI1281845.1 tetratricopeptide repeat-containing serine/threonine-protein kinase [Prevotella sp.]
MSIYKLDSFTTYKRHYQKLLSMSNPSGFIDAPKDNEEDKSQQLISYQNATYIQEGELAEGGTAVCWLLKKCKGPIDRPAHLLKKQLKAQYRNNPNLCDILKHEYETASLLHSEFIARYYSYDPEDSSVFIEYIDGNTLKQFLATPTGKTYFTGSDAYHHIHDFCQQVLNGMQLMHAQRLCHCDLTANNIMIRRDTDHRAVIIDLGMALTQGTTFLIGTTSSLKAPEMILGQICEVNILCDIYMFGLVMQQIASTCPIYEPIYKLCLQENPENRYQSVKEVLKALDEVYSSEVNQQFNRLLGISSDKKKFSVQKSMLYYGRTFVCHVKDLTFVKNSQDYLHLLLEQQNALAEMESIPMTEEDKYEKARLRLYDLNLKIFMFENDVIELAGNIKDNRNIIEQSTYHQISELFLQGKITEAKEMIDKSTLEDEMDALQKTNNRNTKLTNETVKKMLLYISICKNDWKDKSRYQEIEPLLKRCINVLGTIPYDEVQMAHILGNYGVVLSHNGKHEESICTFERAILIYKRQEVEIPLLFHRDIAESHTCIASVFENKGDYAKAIEEFQKASEAIYALNTSREDANILEKVCQINDNIFRNYLRLHDFDKALQFINKVISNAIGKKEHIFILTSAYLCLAKFYSRYQHDYAQAIAYRKKAIPLHKKIERHISNFPFHLVADDYEAIGLYYFQAEKYDEAEASYKKSLQIVSDNHHIGRPFSVESGLAEVKWKKNELEDAENIYRNICAKVDEHNFVIERFRFIRYLTRLISLNLECHHGREARENYEKALSILDNIHPSSNSEIIKRQRDGLRSFLLTFQDKVKASE